MLVSSLKRCNVNRQNGRSRCKNRHPQEQKIPLLRDSCWVIIGPGLAVHQITVLGILFQQTLAFQMPGQATSKGVAELIEFAVGRGFNPGNLVDDPALST